ncbi:phospholipase [Spirilliplanes yamanashiensis]|uniref:Phospholipase n=1 Tax=Spirilliplanes yamanashiensis TaxID=42233 RepID=A0A8J3YBK3_9ACTN|nr:phospholipase [Spirilliplanes yamanashiensis]MDP9817978.1 hypothetical protein [Spirilliplanes yamanashiensis]GIJ04787.1 hypothetical protein Sya03_41390 [Spirilliplanes yamanashiensis]
MSAPAHDHVHHHTLAPSGQGTVMLDIGSGRGALVIHTAPRSHGLEIEVSPVGPGRERRTHAAVRARHVSTGITYCAVIDGLAAGQYTVWRDDGTAAGWVTVPDGGVAEFIWPD